MAKHDKTKTAPNCECGCAAQTKGGRFVPGHDAKLKKALIEAALGGSKRGIARLEALGWTKFLDAKRERAASEKEAGANMTGRKHREAKASRKASGNPKRGSAATGDNEAGAPKISAAKAAADFAPTLDPPLSEYSARMLGFGEKPPLP